MKSYILNYENCVFSEMQLPIFYNPRPYMRKGVFIVSRNLNHKYYIAMPTVEQSL